MLSYAGCHFLRVNSAEDLRISLTAAGKPSQGRVAVTIGNFDGIHRGHRELLSSVISGVRSDADERSALLTFFPHPQDYFAGTLSPRLTTYAERFIQVAQIASAMPKTAGSGRGLDYFIALRFSAELAALSPEQFVERVLVHALNVSRVVVGAEWRFGKGRVGDAALLRGLGERFGFTVETPLILGENGAKISSSDLKRVLPLGDLGAYRALTGRDYECCGKVIRGDERGRTIGFRTANLAPRPRSITLKNGVYKTAVKIVGESAELKSVTNIGLRPTFAGSTASAVVETHILNGFDRDIYGRKIQIRFLERIRDERKFSSVEELKAQIAEDIRSAG